MKTNKITATTIPISPKILNNVLEKVCNTSTNVTLVEACEITEFGVITKSPVKKT